MSRLSSLRILVMLLIGPGLVHGEEGTGTAQEQAIQDLDALRERMEAWRVELERLRGEMAVLKADAQGSAEFSRRLAALEAAQARLEEEIARLAEDIQAALDASESLAESESRAANLSVYGTFTARGYEGENSVFDGESFELVISGRPHKRLSYFAEIEFERAASVGGERGGEIILEQAYANYGFSGLFNLRAGVLLVPFGNVNIDHYAPLRDVISKALVSYVVVPSDWTDNGFGIYGRRLLGDSWLVDYEAYAIAGLGADISARGLRDARQGYGEDNNSDKAVVGRAALRLIGRFEVGLSGYTGAFDDAGQQRLGAWAVDGRIEFGRARITGEYDCFVADGAQAPDTRLSGYYVRITLPFGGTMLKRTLARDFDDPTLSLVGQFDEVVLRGPGDGEVERNREQRVTAGIAYRPAPQWVLKLNYEWNESEGVPLVNGDRNGWLASIGFVF